MRNLNNAMTIPDFKPRKRRVWQLFREIEFALRLGDNRKARSAIYRHFKPSHGSHPDAQAAACILIDCGLDASVISMLMERHQIVDMVMDDPYTLPTLGDVIEYGAYCGCRIRYNRRLGAIVQEHELILEGDHWLLYYSPHGYWVADCVPF